MNSNLFCALHQRNTYFCGNIKLLALKTFQELGVQKDLIKGLKDLNIVEPTQIQSEAIPILLNSKTDLIGQAQTGTGKTAAFGLPLLHRVKPGWKVVQGLILCPTRELGQQIAKQLFKFTKYTDKMFVEAVYGGEPIDRQISRLTRPTHIIVATPGRLIDLVKRKAVDLSNVKTIVMDEADEMLSMGFKKELDQILSFVSTAEEKWLFSATIPPGIKQIIDKHLAPQAHKIEVSYRSVVNKKIQHQFLVCDEAEKLYVLMQFLNAHKGERGMVFCKTKNSTQKLEKQLNAKNIKAGSIHGDLKQIERDKVMRAFVKENTQILVATDIAARGLDIPDLKYVVHFELPDKEEYYAHRSGRTARAGKEGISLAICTTLDLKHIRYFERKLGIAFSQLRAKR